MDLKALWDYMQLDLEADRFSNEMRQSEKRKLLINQTEFLKKQQAQLAKMEQKISEYKEEADRLSALFEDFTKENADIQELSSEDVANRLKTADKLLRAIENCEKQLSVLLKSAETAERAQNDIRKRAAKTKSEYDAIKKEYDVEFANDKIKLKQLRTNADKVGEKLDAADLEKYRQVKQHCTPPIAKLLNQQCTGCFMTLPIGTLRELKSSDTVLTCDNCGRILYAPD